MDLINKAVFGVFKNQLEVDATRAELYSKGFSPNNVSLLYPAQKGPKDFEQHRKTTIRSGALIGAALGGLIIMFIGIMMMTRVSQFTQTASFLQNPLLFILIIISAGIILGAGSGALVGIGTPESAANRLGGYVDVGGTLMAVHVDSEEQIKKARSILEKNNAQDITVLDENQSWEKVYQKVHNA